MQSQRPWGWSLRETCCVFMKENEKESSCLWEYQELHETLYFRVDEKSLAGHQNTNGEGVNPANIKVCGTSLLAEQDSSRNRSHTVAYHINFISHTSNWSTWNCLHEAICWQPELLHEQAALNLVLGYPRATLIINLFCESINKSLRSWKFSVKKSRQRNAKNILLLPTDLNMGGRPQ